MKTKPSIQSTAQPPVRISYDNWFAFIHRIKPIQNTVKDGGVCLNWAMEKTLEKANEVLGNGQ